MHNAVRSMLAAPLFVALGCGGDAMPYPPARDVDVPAPYERGQIVAACGVVDAAYDSREGKIRLYLGAREFFDVSEYVAVWIRDPGGIVFKVGFRSNPRDGMMLDEKLATDDIGGEWFASGRVLDAYETAEGDTIVRVGSARRRAVCTTEPIRQ